MREQTKIDVVCEGCERQFEGVIIASKWGNLGPSSLCEPCIDAEVEAEARALAAGRVKRRLVESGLPKSLRRAAFSQLDESSKARAAAEKWSSSGGGLYLSGAVGVGKSWLAAAALMKRCEAEPVTWVSTATLMTQLRGGFDEGRQEASRLVSSSGSIVLDDLDKASPTEYGLEILFATIENRVQEGSALLVTTNLRPSKLGKRLSVPIMSRLAGYCSAIEITGTDRRLS